MKKNKIFNHSYLPYLSAFFIPLIILSGIFIIKHIVPFGSRTLLENDMLVQYVPFYTELSEKLKNGGSMLYSWSRGMGFDYISEGTYYFFSPLNILLALFNNKTMPLAISLLLMLKCGFAGLNAFIYLKYHFSLKYHLSKSNIAIFIALSSCYALCSYMVNYYTNIIWIDCLAMFPLILLALEKLYINDKPFLYSIYLCITILSNFYIGYMICIFCVLYFLYLIFTDDEKGSFKRIISCFMRFFVYSLIAGALCAFVLIPAFFTLTTTDSGGLNFYDNIETYYPVFVTFFRQMFSANPTYWHHPYLYCTDLVFLLFPLYFFNKNISLKERIGKFLLYFIMIISFQINLLDFVWNGFHRVNCFAGRQSFIFIFLVIVICAETILNNAYKNNKGLLISYMASLCLFLIINSYFDFSSTFKCVIINIAIVSIYLLILIALPKRKCFYGILLSALICEIALSAYERIDSGILYRDYLNNINNTETALHKIEDNSFYRIKNLQTPFKNDGSLCNYYNIATYSSLANTKLSGFLHKIGYPVCLNAMGNTSSEPVFRNIFCEKYIISSNKDLGTDNLTSISSAETAAIYKNPDALSIAFEVTDCVTDSSTFEGANPFERINSFANSISGCGELYEPVLSDNDKITVEAGNHLYLYSKQQLSNASFISAKLTEELYTDNMTGVSLLRNPDDDNYIYYVHTSPYGGYIQLPKNVHSSDIIAYTLNSKNYKKFTDFISSCQMDITAFGDRHIEGNITADYNGTIMTSIPYSEGWTVKVDNKKVKTFDIKNALLAFKIDNGFHSIEFSYIPKGFKTGCIISMTALVLLIISIILFYRNAEYAA